MSPATPPAFILWLPQAVVEIKWISVYAVELRRYKHLEFTAGVAPVGNRKTMRHNGASLATRRGRRDEDTY
jgi:hypothetical protein